MRTEEPPKSEKLHLSSQEDKGIKTRAAGGKKRKIQTLTFRRYEKWATFENLPNSKTC